MGNIYSLKMEMEIRFRNYTDIDEVSFDFGEVVKEEDIFFDTDDKRDKQNQLFGITLQYVINHNGRLIINNGRREYAISLENGYNLESGYYIVNQSYRSGEDYNVNIFTIKKLEDIYEGGVLDLIKDFDRCREIRDELKQYEREQTERVGLSYLYIYDDELEDDWEEKGLYNGLTIDEIEDKILTRYKDIVDEAIEGKVEEDLASNIKSKRVENAEEKLDKGEDFEIDFNDKMISFIGKENAILISDSERKPITKVIFKTLFDIKRIGFSRFKELMNGQRIKDYILDKDISFEYKIPKINDFGEVTWENMVEIDFENMTFNGIKVAKNKIKFFYNRAYDKGFNREEFRDEDYILQLNKLSGIKVDCLSLEKIRSGDLEFKIDINLIDRETFEVDFLGHKKTCEWNFLKENLTYGQNVTRELSKGKFLRFGRELGISDDDIFMMIRKQKILKSLKGDETNE